MFRSFETGRSEELFRRISLFPLSVCSPSLFPVALQPSQPSGERRAYVRNVDGNDLARDRAIVHCVRESRPASLRVLLRSDRTGDSLLLRGSPSAGDCMPCIVQDRSSVLRLMYASQINSVHKLVCGERSHPFRLPPFSREEADVVLMCAALPIKGYEDALLKLQILKACGAQHSNQLDVSAGTLGFAVGQKVCILTYSLGFIWQRILAALIGTSSSMHKEQNADVKNKVVHKLREMVAIDQCRQMRKIGMPPQVRVTTTYNSLTQGTPAIDELLPWHSLFCHRATANAPLAAARDELPAGFAQDELHKLVSLSLESLRNFLADALNDADVGSFARTVKVAVEEYTAV